MEGSNKAVVAILALLGTAGLAYYMKNKSSAKAQSLPPNGMTYDAGMDADTQTAINSALMNETNPTNLRQLALGCRSKGYVKAAAALEAKAASIDAMNSSLPGSVPSNPTNLGNNTVPASPKDIPTVVSDVLNTTVPGIASTPSNGATANTTDTPPSKVLQVMPIAQLLADKSLEAPMTILQVQQALNVVYPNVKLVEDGVNGPKTTDAVKSYQAHKGLKVDGIPGPQTWKALRQDLIALG